MLYSAMCRAGFVEPVCSPDPKEIGIQKRQGLKPPPAAATESRP